MKKVNTHIHTPHSFSAFTSTEQAVKLAAKAELAVLGINDFNCFDGFAEFEELCLHHRIHPLFNMEFIALSEEDRSNGIRWNDPKNPGNIYFCGKALAQPTAFGEDSLRVLEDLFRGSQEHIAQVIDKLIAHADGVGSTDSMDYATILRDHAVRTVRERHVALAVYAHLKVGPKDEALRLLGTDLDLSNSSAAQNTIRGVLLKNGKPAYVPEPASAYLPLDTIRGIVLDGGGIPCYPVLADDSSELSEMESDPKALAARLQELGVHAVEFIPLRNTIDHLEHYATALWEEGFSVTFGTEHNTPDLIDMLPMARNDVSFGSELATMAFQGACLLAAHQDCVAHGQTGFVKADGSRAIGLDEREAFVEHGRGVIEKTNG